MSSIIHANLNWNESGTPISEQFDDVYFSNQNGLEESRYVFLTQNGLPERFSSHHQSRFVVAETGFGTGLNFLALWQLFHEYKNAHPDANVSKLHFISFEKYPVTLDDLTKAHQAWPELAPFAALLQAQYPIAIEECQRLIFEDGAITLDLWFGDIHDNLPQIETTESGLVDAWFLDGFAPSKNPSMWNQNLFDQMARLARKEPFQSPHIDSNKKIDLSSPFDFPNAGTCATFTAAGFVRRGLIEAGFNIQKVKGFGHKREMLAGSYALESHLQNANTSPLVKDDIQNTKHGEENCAIKDNSSLQSWLTRNPATPESLQACFTQKGSNTSNQVQSSIAIIGAGIAGIALADALLKRGFHVSLYCEDEMAGLGASSNNQGAIYPLITEKNSLVNRFFAPAFLFAKRYFNAASKQISFAHQWSGVTQLAWSDKAKHKLDKMRQADYPASFLHSLSPEETSKIVGLDVPFESIFHPQGGWLAPREFTQNMAQKLAQNPKCQIHYSSSVKSLNKTTHSLEEKTNSQTWQLEIQTKENQTYKRNHPIAVIANGYQFSKFTQTKAIPSTAVKGQVSHIPTTPKLTKLKTVLCYNGYFTPQDPNLAKHCIGASHDRENLNREFDLNAQHENIEKIKKCFFSDNQVRSQQDERTHQMSQATLDISWVDDIDASDNQSRQGIRSVSRDHFAFVGNVPNYVQLQADYNKYDPQKLRENHQEIPALNCYTDLFCFIGLGGRGLCSAPLLAETLASQIAGDPFPLPRLILDKIHPARMWLQRIKKGRPLKV